MLDKAIGLLGLALALIFGFWSIAPDRLPKIPAWAIYSGILAAVFLIGLSVGLLIADQRRGFTEAPQPKPPQLKLSMLGANIFTPDAIDVRDRLTGLAIDAKIWNIGGPTIVTEWLLFIIPQNATPIAGQLTEIPEVLRLGGQYSTGVVRASDSLLSKTKNTSVQSARVDGTLLFYAAMKKDIIVAPTTRLELIAKDIYGGEALERRALSFAQS